jgi:hypothetical protein
MNIIPNETEPNRLLQAALRYARRGWPVMPLHGIAEGKCTCGDPVCDSPGKHPRTHHGCKDATTDETTIRQWWAQWPDANVGIATGAPSGIFMVGPDGQAGIDAFIALAQEHTPLPSTPRARSGGDGKHYIFGWPSQGGSIKNSRNHRGLPIDVRGAGGLIVAAPSRHKSGGSYEWEVPPEDVGVAQAPEWLLEWVRGGRGTGKRKKRGDEETNKTNQFTQPAQPGINSFNSLPTAPPASNKLILTVQSDRSDVQARAIIYLERCPPAVSHDGGHNQTFDVARAVVYGFNLGPDAGFDLLWQHYNPRCLPPWSETELRHKCLEADTKPFDKPRGYLLTSDSASEAISSFNSFVRSADTVQPSDDDIEALPMSPPAPWPVLPPEALHGLAGDIVQAIAPQTESDPVAILGQMLVAFGNAAGRGAHYRVEGDRHHTNLFLCLVGRTSRGRKGTSRGRVMQLMNFADPEWCRNCVVSGLTSGEGLIWAVRDPIERNEPIKHKGRITGYQMVVADEGVGDKRLLADESEFAQILKVLQREGNSLSPVIRQCWDTGNLRTLTKNSPARATDAHVGMSVHITQEELRKHLKDTEAFNGFANRFLWLCAKRARLLPDGGQTLDVSALGVKLNFALATARTIGEMARSQPASRLWHEVYPQLTAERNGLHGAVTGRAEAQVLRLSMIYALLDCRSTIDEAHIRAAMALWSYADASAQVVFGAEVEDPLLGLVLAKLQAAQPAGMTRTDLHNAFSRNMPAVKLLEALAKLRDRGSVYCETTKTGKPGAPAERWYPLRTNELNELMVPSSEEQGSRGINSFNSSIRRASTASVEEVVTL